MVSINRLIWRFRGHRLVRDLSFQLLPHPAVVTNPLYRLIYERRIRRKAQEYLAYPHAISIESTNWCNAKCWLCPYPKMTRKKGIMAEDLFDRILEQVKHIPMLSMFLSGFGEPLLDPNLERKCQKAKQVGIHRVSFYTNGQLLDKTRARNLVDAGIDAIDISIDAGTPATFNRLRRGLDFDTVIANVRYLAGIRRGDKPFITVDMLVAGKNGAEKDRLANLLMGCYDRLVVRQPDDWIGSIKLPAGAKTPHRRLPLRYHPPCKHLWDMMVVYWDGTVPLCCHDYDARCVMGNTAQESIDTVWVNQAFGRYRSAHLARTGFELELCRDCQFFTIWW